MNDPRFDGTITWAKNRDEYLDDSGLTVGVLGASVVNDEGAWRMVPEAFFETPGVRSPLSYVPNQFVMVGEGSYEGYYAVFAFDANGNANGTLDGFIFQGELPPAPESLPE